MYYDLENFDIQRVEIKSQALSGNPLGDPAERINPILFPKKAEGQVPLIFVLAGFSGNGPQYLNKKFGAPGFVDVLDQAVNAGEAPQAAYVLVDAMTCWGGSQFINSPGSGRYQDYICDELLPTCLQGWSVDPGKVAVVGGSSGGYGALHLASQFPEKFPWAAAVAPDGCFDLSLLPEIVKTLGKIIRLGGAQGVFKLLQSGDLWDRRDWHDLLNVVGMAFCYAEIVDGEPVWPIDPHTAETNPHWESWKLKDPLHFLGEREEALKSLKGIFLDVGERDQFNLQFATRRISRLLREKQVNHHYSEFNGTHFDIGGRRKEVWKWLKKEWGF